MMSNIKFKKFINYQTLAVAIIVAIGVTGFGYHIHQQRSKNTAERNQQAKLSLRSNQDASGKVSPVNTGASPVSQPAASSDQSKPTTANVSGASNKTGQPSGNTTAPKTSQKTNSSSAGQTVSPTNSSAVAPAALPSFDISINPADEQNDGGGGHYFTFYIVRHNGYSGKVTPNAIISSTNTANCYELRSTAMLSANKGYFDFGMPACSRAYTPETVTITLSAYGPDGTNGTINKSTSFQYSF